MCVYSCVHSCTGWRRPIGCHKLQVIFRKRAINYRALLQKMTCKNNASYGSSPPCIHIHSCEYEYLYMYILVYTNMYTRKYIWMDMRTCMFVCSYVDTHHIWSTCEYMYIYSLVHMHTYMCMKLNVMHTYMQMKLNECTLYTHITRACIHRELRCIYVYRCTHTNRHTYKKIQICINTCVYI